MTQNLKLAFGTEKHQEVLDAINARINLSRESMSKYYTKWAEKEEQFLAYLPESETTKAYKNLRKEGKPQYATMQIPYSYAMMMTAHAYLTTIFLSRIPTFQFAGRHGETEQQVRSIEAVMDYQRQVGEMLVPLYLWLYDAEKYGLGVVGQYWDEQIIRSTTIESEQPNLFGIPLSGQSRQVKRTIETPGYQGNKLYNVRPQDFFPDPRVPVWKLQDGEFCGRMVDVGWNTILNGAAKGNYYNMEALRKHKSTSERETRDQGSSQMNLPVQDYADIKDMSNTKLLEIYIELVPNEWSLGASKFPEKWVFVVANDAVIIGSQPYDAQHGKFPFFALEPELNGYSFINRSPLDVVENLQAVMDWLINSHFYNVRKSLNDMFVVDPSRIEMADVLDPGAGAIWRLKPAAYGTDPRLAVHQLDVRDVTIQNVGDMKMIHEIMQRVSGITDQIAGQQTGGRKTGQEIRSSATFGVNRLKTRAELYSAQGFVPLSSVMVQTTQQRYKQEQVFRIAGSTAAGQSPWVNVNPEVIAGFYDYVPVDGTMPIDKLALSNTWKELFSFAAKVPEIAQRYDMGRMLEYAMELAGAKNLDQFRIEVRPDEQLQDQAQRGNTVPLNRPTAASTEIAPGPAPLSGGVGRLQ